ncbi:transmembrane protein 273 [Gopherus flavomarginatus]|uniref:transmembrane protein 273 n=1 Tax=Gopherus flavomarginatus TaxID=286002 RepID=UPI0021CBF5BE|nr:transmembrane protein 273 [Gopherus flavomarginatus]
MILQTSWIPVLTTFLLLLHFWRAKVSASGTSEEEVIDPKYVIIGVTLGVFLAIGFLALKICMIKRQLIDNDFVDSDNRVDKRSHVESAAMRYVLQKEPGGKSSRSSSNLMQQELGGEGGNTESLMAAWSQI